MEKKNDKPSRPVPIPDVIVIGPDGSEEEEEVNRSIIPSDTEEDQSIIKDLIRAHPTSDEQNVDELIASGSSTSQTHAEIVRQSQIAPNWRKHVAKENVVPATMTESTVLKPSGSPKRSRQEWLTDDELADLEVSHITSSLQPIPAKRTTTTRPTATFMPIQQPPGKLPDISTLDIPRVVPMRRDTHHLDFPIDQYDFSSVKFPALREMHFSSSSSDYDFPSVNGSSTRRRTSPHNLSPYNSSPEDRPPTHWQTERFYSLTNKEHDVNRMMKSFEFVEKVKIEEEEEVDPKDQPGPSKPRSSNSKDSSSKGPKSKK